MKKEYLEITVYEALQKRFEYIFQTFDNIYVSFSGGKDSGLLLNLLLYFIRILNPNIRSHRNILTEHLKT